MVLITTKGSIKISTLAILKIDETMVGYPTIDMGIAGIKFLTKCAESMKNGSIWVNIN
ncbi:MAG: hypothetical protein U5N58_08660 [Actinomycetota bacterium]|nr:hypothetical protein [Actinomycetota bacterium]